MMAADLRFGDADAALGTGSVAGVLRIGPDAYCGLAFGGATGPQTPFHSHQVHFLPRSLDICESPLDHLDPQSPPFPSSANLIWGCWTTKCSAELRTGS